MKDDSPPDVTALLRAWSGGDRSAQETLWPIVYDELKRLAHRQMRRERPEHTLQTGALVNEAYLRLVGWRNAKWKNRAHFFGMCARMMRQILVDYARSRGYQRRGSGRPAVSHDEAIIVAPSKCAQLLALDDALKRLAELMREKAPSWSCAFSAVSLSKRPPMCLGYPVSR